MEQGTHEDLLKQKGHYYLLYSQNELKDESVTDEGMVRLG